MVLLLVSKSQTYQYMLRLSSAFVTISLLTLSRTCSPPLLHDEAQRCSGMYQDILQTSEPLQLLLFLLCSHPSRQVLKPVCNVLHANLLVVAASIEERRGGKVGHDVMLVEWVCWVEVGSGGRWGQCGEVGKELWVLELDVKEVGWCIDRSACCLRSSCHGV